MPKNDVSLWGNEPTALLALAGAALTLAVTFGLNLTPDQQGAITSFLFVLVGFLTRTQVASVQALNALDPAKGEGV